MPDSHIESLYQEANSALKSRDYDYAIELLKRVLVIDETYKDTSRLLEKAVRLRKLRWYKNPRLWGALGLVAVFILGFVIAPKIGSFASPAPTNTISPTATNTALLTATPTSPPTVTPTSTARPMPTATPLPSWVTDFAEPILAYIADHPPTYEDDFDQPSEDWAVWSGHHGSTTVKYKFENGKLVVTDWTVYRRGFQFHDYVVEVDAQFIPNSPRPSWLQIRFRDNNCMFRILENSLMEASCYEGDHEIGNIRKGIAGSGSNSIYRLRLIVKDTRFAFYVNEVPMGYFEHGYVNTGNAMLEAENGYGWFDNFKVWDLDKVPNLP